MEGQALGRVIILPATTVQEEEKQYPEIELVGEEIDMGEANVIVGTLFRDPILDILAPITDAMPLLNPPLDGLEALVAEVLEDIGCAPSGIEVVSMTKNRELALMLSDDARRFILLDPHDAIDRSINWLMGSAITDMLSDRYSEGLEAKLGGDRVQRLKNDLWKDIVLRHVADGRKEFGQLAERLLYVTYLCVYHQMAFQMSGMTEMAGVMEKLCSLCVSGNYPLGLLCDKRFLVFTA